MNERIHKYQRIAAVALLLLVTATLFAYKADLITPFSVIVIFVLLGGYWIGSEIALLVAFWNKRGGEK